MLEKTRTVQSFCEFVQSNRGILCVKCGRTLAVRSLGETVGTQRPCMSQPRRLKRQLKVGVWIANLYIGGVARWLETLMRWCEDVTWTGVFVPNRGPTHTAVVKSIQRYAPVFAGPEKHNHLDHDACECVLQRTYDEKVACLSAINQADLVLAWPDNRLEEFSLWKNDERPVLLVSHGVCKWTTEQMHRNWRGASHYAAVIEQGRSTFPERIQYLVKIAPNGVEIDRTLSSDDPVKLRKRFNLPASKKIVTYVGRFSPEKGIHRLAGVIKSLPNDYHGFFIGRGYDDAKIKMELLESSGGRITFADACWHSIGDHLACSDVLASLAPDEAGPISILEAMTARVPVVGVDTGLLKDWKLRDIDGFFQVAFLEKTDEDIGEAIQRAATLSTPALLDAAERHVKKENAARKAAAAWASLFSQAVAD